MMIARELLAHIEGVSRAACNRSTCPGWRLAGSVGWSALCDRLLQELVLVDDVDRQDLDGPVADDGVARVMNATRDDAVLAWEALPRRSTWLLHCAALQHVERLFAVVEVARRRRAGRELHQLGNDLQVADAGDRRSAELSPRDRRGGFRVRRHDLSPHDRCRRARDQHR